MRSKVLPVLLGFVLLYLCVGFLWASVGGFRMWEVGNRVAEHDHHEIFVEATDAFIDDDGVLRVCIRGRKASCGHHKTPIEDFSFTTPVALVWRDRAGALELELSSPKWSPRSLYVPRARIGPACGPLTSGEPVDVVRLPETVPSDYFDGLDDRELQKLRPAEGRAHAVFEVPMSFDAARFHERRDIVYVSSDPDEEGLHYYELHIKPLLKADPVSDTERGVAFARDVVEFPYQILMLLDSHH